jgi:hypothetical protein
MLVQPVDIARIVDAADIIPIPIISHHIFGVDTLQLMPTEGLLSMSKFVHLLLQIGSVAVSAGTLVTGVVPAQYKALVVAVVGAIQAALAIANHKS